MSDPFLKGGGRTRRANKETTHVGGGMKKEGRLLVVRAFSLVTVVFSLLFSLAFILFFRHARKNGKGGGERAKPSLSFSLQFSLDPPPNVI